MFMRGMSAFRHWVEGHFSALLIVACGFGLAVPALGHVPDQAAVVVLALLMFVSCFRLGEGSLSQIHFRTLVTYHLVRYAMLPFVWWGVGQIFIPEYALGLFLLAALPAGVSSPAIATIYGGAVAPGFAIVIVSQLITPLLLPALFVILSFYDGGVASPVMPKPYDLFVTMVWCILLPMGLYALLRRQRHLSAVIQRNGKVWSMLLVAFVIALVVSKQRETLLAEGSSLFVALVVALACFASFIVIGWRLARKQPQETRITYAICSCFNNAALGVSLALLHFPAPIIIFVAVSEMAWSLLPLLFSVFLRVVGISR